MPHKNHTHLTTENTHLTTHYTHLRTHYTNLPTQNTPPRDTTHTHHTTTCTTPTTRHQNNSFYGGREGLNPLYVGGGTSKPSCSLSTPPPLPDGAVLYPAIPALYTQAFQGIGRRYKCLSADGSCCSMEPDLPALKFVGIWP